MSAKSKFSVSSSKAISLALKNKYLLDIQESADIECLTVTEIPDILGDLFFGEVSEFIQMQGVGSILSIEEVSRYALQTLLHKFLNFKRYSFEYEDLYTMFELCGKDLENWIGSNIPLQYPWGKFGIHNGELSVLRLEIPKIELPSIEKATVIRRWGNDVTK